MGRNYENLARSYLRLNGYFTIDSFIVHDPSRISQSNAGKKIGNKAETDIIGIRMPYSNEVSGDLYIANHPPLVDPHGKKLDAVIVEVKSGNTNNPNPVWRTETQARIDTAAYIIRFFGLYKKEKSISIVARRFLQGFRYEDRKCRLRFIILSEKPNKHWHAKGIHYITWDDVFQFLIAVRGQCWIAGGIGVASLHHQWDEPMKAIFDIANNESLTLEERCLKIRQLLRDPHLR